MKHTEKVMTGSELRDLALRYEIRVMPSRQGDGYLARVPAFPTIFTSGDTPAEALANGYEGIECAIEGLLMDGEPLPQPDAQVEDFEAEEEEAREALAEFLASGEAGKPVEELRGELGLDER